MLQARVAVLLVLLPAVLSGCAYVEDFKPGDLNMLILIAAMFVMFGFFGAITRGRNEILDASLIRGQRHRQEVHEIEDEIRLKRDAMYHAQQELLGFYDRVLTEAQRSRPELVAQRRKLLELERDILTAESKRLQLLKNEPTT